MNEKRKLATIAIVKEIKQIEGADNIELAIIRNWQCVIAKSDNIKVGDFVVYFEIDSKLNGEMEEFAFMENRGYKVKTIKLRGELSQGLAMPIEKLSKYLQKVKFEEGVDVTDELKVTKIPERNSHGPNNSKELILPNPESVKKTGAERIQNLELDDINFESCRVTEKIDGQSTTYSTNAKNGFITISSHNNIICEYDIKNDAFVKKEFKKTLLSRIPVLNKIIKPKPKMQYVPATKVELQRAQVTAFNDNIVNVLKDNVNLVIQGEVVGANASGAIKNYYNLKPNEVRFYAFNVYEYSPETLHVQKDIKMLKDTGINIVPFIEEDISYLEFLNKYSITSVNDLLNFVEMKSAVNSDIWIEGIVISDNSNIDNVKVISNKFLLIKNKRDKKEKTA